MVQIQIDLFPLCLLLRRDRRDILDISNGHGRKMMSNENKVPNTLEPVLAEITIISELGRSTWYEVVYYDDIFNDKWESFAGSDTFRDCGYKVLNWKYCKEIFNNEQHTQVLQITNSTRMGSNVYNDS